MLAWEGAADGKAHATLDSLLDLPLGYSEARGTAALRSARSSAARSLTVSVRRITSEPADFFGIRERGRLTPGFAADIAIFDYNTIACSPRESTL